MDGPHGGDGPDDDGDGDGRFDRPAQTREDSEARFAPRAPFAGRNGDPNRERDGAKNGAVVYGGPAAFFGEEGGGEDMVAPLGLAGVDPAAQAPAQDPQLLKDIVATDLEEQLIALGWRTGTDIEAFYNQLGDGSEGEEVQRQLVVDTAESLERKGYTPAQIAEGMRVLGYDFLNEYVGANAGDLRPAPIEPAYRPPPVDPFAGLPSAPSAPVRDRLAALYAEGRKPREYVSGVGLTNLRPEAREFKPDLGKMGLPTSRAELLAMDTDQMRGVGAKIPKEYGGPYKPRADSKRASVRTALIERLKKIDPSF